MNICKWFFWEMLSLRYNMLNFLFIYFLPPGPPQHFSGWMGGERLRYAEGKVDAEHGGVAKS